MMRVLRVLSVRCVAGAVMMRVLRVLSVRCVAYCTLFMWCAHSTGWHAGCGDRTRTRVTGVWLRHARPLRRRPPLSPHRLCAGHHTFSEGQDLLLVLQEDALPVDASHATPLTRAATLEARLAPRRLGQAPAQHCPRGQPH